MADTIAKPVIKLDESKLLGGNVSATRVASGTKKVGVKVAQGLKPAHAIGSLALA